MKKYILLIVVFFQIGFIKSQSLYFPPITGNTWDSLSPSSLGYCQARIDSLYAYLNSKGTKSFIIVKDGKRVLEKYFGTYTRDSIWYWASVSKSLASIITGVAQQKGYININSNVSQYLGSGWTSAPLVKENLITVKHLISMTSGLDDQTTNTCSNEDTAKACLIYKADAGTRWAYHTGAYRKVQDVVSTAVGQTYNAITNNWIEAKTGMNGFWSQQVYYSKARDMARFGLLALNKGIWQTDTILKDSLYFKNMVNTAQSFNLAYGYLWWLNGKANGMAPSSQLVYQGPMFQNAPSDLISALGKNDQKIYVSPSQKLVIVRQGNTAGGFSLAASGFDDVLWDYINKLTCSTGLNEYSSVNDFVCYPNPISNELNIQSNKAIQSIRIIDALGNDVYVRHHILENNYKIDFTEFSQAYYNIEVAFTDRVVVRKKIVK